MQVHVHRADARLSCEVGGCCVDVSVSTLPLLLLASHWMSEMCAVTWLLYPTAQGHVNEYTHPFNGPFSGTTQVSRYQIGETHLDFIEARDNEWQWHQLGHMQVCTLLQIDNHASNPPLSFYRPDALPAAQPTVSKH